MNDPAKPGWLHRASAIPADGKGALLGCVCLTVNGVGEQRPGEPHARFDRGPAGEVTTIPVEMGEKPSGWI
jgi:hypothetical protein